MSRNFQPFTFVNAEDKPAGLFVDIWNLWSEKTGIRIEFLPSAWNESIENLKTGSADIHSGLAMTPEREQLMIFSQALYENSFCLFFPLKQGKALPLKELSGQKVAVVQNSSQEEYLRKNCPDIRLVLFKSTLEAILSARDGNVRAVADAYLSTSSDIMRLGLSGNFECGKEILYSKTFHAGLLKENHVLLETVNKGFDAISENELVEIEKRWIPDSEKRYFKPDASKISLTAEEEAWIRTHNTVRMGIPPEFPPLRIYTKEGIKGFVVDYLNLISERTGIHFELVAMEYAAGAGGADAMLKSGRIDMFNTFYVPKRPEYSIFTKPFTEFKVIIITRNDAPFMDGISVLRGKKVAVIKGLGVYNKVVNSYPGIEGIEMNSMEELFRAVSESKVYATLSAPLFAGYLMRNYPNLKIAGVTDHPPEPYMYAVRKDYPELVRIINKVIESVSREEQDAVFEKWCGVRLEYRPNWSEIMKRVYAVVSFFIVILGISLLWNRRLAREIDDRRNTEESLRQSRELLKTLMNAVPASITLVDCEGSILLTNETASRSFSLSPDEMTGKKFYDLMPRQLTESRKLYSDAVILTGRTLIFEDCFKGQYVQNYITPAVSGKNGEVLQLAILSLDVTARRLAEEQLKLAKVQADAANRAKSEFLANMSHEIRTPLNSVIGFGDLLASMITDEKQKNYLNAVRSGGRSLLMLINDILDMSKIEAGKLELKPESFSIRNVFEDMRQIFSLNFSEKELEFISDISYNIPEVLLLDEFRLRQILSNLIGNALKFTEKGHIKLSVRGTGFEVPGKSPGASLTRNPESRTSHPEPRTPYLNLMIAVEDTGIGISPEFHERIFHAFEQGRQSAEKYGGTGLGLSITKRLVEMMNGSISLKSEPGKGSIFEIIFRDVGISESASAAGKTAMTSDETVAFESKVILIADDLQSNRELIAAFFAGMPMGIIEAENGQEAVSLAEHHKPDIILMDIRMPVMDGYEAARQLKGNEKLRHIPVIATTASALSEDTEKIMQDGLFDGFIAKPVRKSDLFRELNRLVLHPEENRGLEEKKEKEYLPPELIVILENELMRSWEETCRSRVLGDIETFAEKIRSAGLEYSSGLLIGYGRELITHVHNFDIEKVRSVLYSYPKLIENIKAR